MTWDYYDIKKNFEFVEGQFKDETETTDAVLEFKKGAMKMLKELSIDAANLSKAKKLFGKFLDEVKE